MRNHPFLLRIEDQLPTIRIIDLSGASFYIGPEAGQTDEGLREYIRRTRDSLNMIEETGKSKENAGKRIVSGGITSVPA